MVTLGPNGGMYDGGQVTEQLSGFGDGCYSKYGGPYMLGAPLALSTAVSNSSYLDNVGVVNDAWINEYTPKTSGGGSCTWGGSQSMEFQGQGYGGGGDLGSTLSNGDYVEVFRGGASGGVSWP